MINPSQVEPTRPVRVRPDMVVIKLTTQSDDVIRVSELGCMPVCASLAHELGCFGPIKSFFFTFPIMF